MNINENKDIQKVISSKGTSISINSDRNQNKNKVLNIQESYVEPFMSRRLESGRNGTRNSQILRDSNHYGTFQVAVS